MGCRSSGPRGARPDRGSSEASGRGNLGDVKPTSEAGISEMRIDHATGYRLYFTRRWTTLVVLLCGGTKKGQSADIRRAKAVARDLED